MSRSEILRYKLAPFCIVTFLQAVIIFQFYLYYRGHGMVLYSREEKEKEPSKPHIVFGILSAESKRDLRDTQRKTWISTALHADIPFNLTYKFLIDIPSDSTAQENLIHNDIIHLNVTTHGYAKKYGEKIYKWMKYIVQNYPDAILGARIDDDVFLCVPQVFEKLNLIKSRKLYYGWAHGSGNKINKLRRVDEMFVVFGRELMERIDKRKYCENMETCDSTVQLVEMNWGDESLATWLSIYDDVDFITDNDRIIHFGAGSERRYAHYIQPDFCKKNLLYHKSTPVIMHKLHFYNKGSVLGGNISNFVNNEALTGSVFSGALIREAPVIERLRLLQNINIDFRKPCAKWAVVTTIYSLSKAIKDVSEAPNWCLVIVTDIKTPDVFINRTNVKLLTIEDQYKIYPLLAESIPLSNLGRKNIGYVYAIQHGAQAIWDFDDDNVGMINIEDFNASASFVSICKDLKSNVANPYPYFGVKDNRTWPRGFPLQYIQQASTAPQICESQDNIKLGVVQSLANVEPDVDAIYRLTHDLPFHFIANKETPLPPLVIPQQKYAPFNAQATLWLPPAFKYLALPVSVHGRVSDIWRAYIAQHFMHKDGIHLAFSKPYVTQIRNNHDNMRDFNAELDLYQKSKQLVDFLSSKEASTIQDLMSMYEQLYRRGYLEEDDLNFMNRWTQMLFH